MLLSFIHILLVLFLHNFYVSVTHINYAAEQAELQITLKMFTDDLQVGVLENTGEKLLLINGTTHPKADSLIFSYLMYCNGYFLNGKSEAETVHYIGYEPDNEAIWCYMEIKNVSKLNQIKVQSTLLLSVFQKQSNLIFVKAFGKEKGIHLYGDKKNDTVTF